MKRITCAALIAFANLIYAAPSVSAASAAAPAVVPQFAVSTTTLDFGPQFSGSVSAVRTVVVTAGSDAPVSLIAEASGNFEATPKSCELAPSASCSISITFRPTDIGTSGGALTLHIVSARVASSKVISLLGRGSTRCNDTTDDGSCGGLGGGAWVGAGILFYLLCVIVVRWNMIVLPTRELLRKEIDAIRNQAKHIAATAGHALPGIGRIDVPLDAAQNLIAGGWDLRWLLDVIFWTRGKEIAGWKNVHAAEVLMASYLPREGLKAALEHLEMDLRGIDKNAKALALANSINVALVGTHPASIKRQRALLAEAIDLVTEQIDLVFTRMTAWHNKVTWLIGCGLMLIVLLATALQHEVLFLMGAVGGLLSRLQRALKHENTSTDYGAEWTSLFLSPVAGALAGWSGILLIIVAAELHLLGTPLKIDWCNPYTPLALGSALLLGISERSFDALVQKLDKAVETEKNTAKADKDAKDKGADTANTLQSPPAGNATSTTSTVLKADKPDGPSET